MEAIEIGSPNTPLNTVGNSITFNKKALISIGLTAAIVAFFYVRYNQLEKEKLMLELRKKKSS